MTTFATRLALAAIEKRSSAFIANIRFTTMAATSMKNPSSATPLRWKSTLTTRPTTKTASPVPISFSSNGTVVPLFTKSMSSTAISKNSAGSMLWPSSGGASGSARFQPTGTRSQPQPQHLQQQDSNRMDWNTYFALRKTRRTYENVFMVPCGALGLSGAGFYFLLQPFDPTPIFGLDQLLVYGIGTIAAGLLGVAVGPVMGNMIFRATHSKARPLVDTMDREFHKHIVKYRVDPTRNSGRNIVPDFYGEKIKSISDYRKWLRKQRAFRRAADGLKL